MYHCMMMMMDPASAYILQINLFSDGPSREYEQEVEVKVNRDSE